MQNRISETRQALVVDGQVLVKDVNRLKRDAVQIAEDVRKHANAHVTPTKQRVTDTLALARETFNANAWALIGAGLALGLFIGFAARRRSAPAA